MSRKILDEFTDRKDLTRKRKLALRNKMLRGLCWCGQPRREGAETCQRCLDRAVAHNARVRAELLSTHRSVKP